MSTTALTDPITFRNAVRIECGSPAVADLSDDTIDQKIALTLDRIRSSAPGADETETFLLDSFTLVDGTQSYAVPSGRKITEVWYRPIDPTFYIPAGPTQEFANIPIAVFQPGLYLRSDELMSEISRAQAQNRYQTRILGGRVYFDPIPDGTITTAYYSYVETGGALVPATLSMTTIRALLYGTTAACCQVLANRAGQQTTAIAGRGLVNQTRGPEWSRMARQYEEMFGTALMELSIRG